MLLSLVILAMYPRMCTQLGIQVHKIMPFFDSHEWSSQTQLLLICITLYSYFIHRLIMAAIFTFTPEMQQQYILQQILSIAILVFHANGDDHWEGSKPADKGPQYCVLFLCMVALAPSNLSMLLLLTISTTLPWLYK